MIETILTHSQQATNAAIFFSSIYILIIGTIMTIVAYRFGITFKCLIPKLKSSKPETLKINYNGDEYLCKYYRGGKSYIEIIKNGKIIYRKVTYFTLCLDWQFSEEGIKNTIMNQEQKLIKNGYV